MAQYEVLKRFRLYDDPKEKTSGEVKEVGQIIDIPVKRASQVESNLDDTYLRRIEKEKGAK